MVMVKIYGRLKSLVAKIFLMFLFDLKYDLYDNKSIGYKLVCGLKASWQHLLGTILFIYPELQMQQIITESIR